MKLTAEEARFLTALAREQNQTGCRGPAHDLLRKHVYPDAPLRGPGSLAFSYEAVPLTGVLIQDLTDLQEMDDFLRKGERDAEAVWPWSSSAEYRMRLEEARTEWSTRRAPEGGESLLAEVDDFAEELARVRQNEPLMQLLCERAEEKTTLTLKKVREELGKPNRRKTSRRKDGA